MHRDTSRLHLFDSARWLPYVVVDFAKQPVADHHARAARFVVIEPDKTLVPVFGVEIRPVAWQNVGVQIDFHRLEL